MVLSMLQKSPFEPLCNASLKLTTFKAAFLMAISTFRRCSDLQSLKLGEGFACVQKKGVMVFPSGTDRLMMWQRYLYQLLHRIFVLLAPYVCLHIFS